MSPSQYITDYFLIFQKHNSYVPAFALTFFFFFSLLTEAKYPIKNYIAEEGSLCLLQGLGSKWERNAQTLQQHHQRAKRNLVTH